MGREKTEATRRIVDAAAAYDELADHLASVHIMRYSELPRIDLYLDQVLTLVSDELSFMCLPGEAPLTGSMVNNYVKQHVVPAPTRKRYNRRHLSYLVFVCSLKRVFTIAQVAELIEALVAEGVDLATSHDEVCATLEGNLARCLTPCDPATLRVPRLLREDGTPLEGELPRIVATALSALAEKVYVEQAVRIELDHARTLGRDGRLC